MSAVEWLGFFISAFFVFFLVGKAIYDAVQNEQNPSKYKAQQEEAERRFKAFLRGESASPNVDRVLREIVEDDEDEEEDRRPRRMAPARKAAPVQRVPFKQPTQVAPQNTKLLPTVEARGNSRAKNLVLQQSSPTNIVILSEILGPPKGMR